MVMVIVMVMVMVGSARLPASFFSNNSMMFSSISTGETHFE